MNRKEFLKLLCSGALVSTISPSSLLFAEETSCCSKKNRKNKKIRIGICTDVHQEYFAFAQERLKQFIDHMNREKPDFIIQLGDFCDANPKNDEFMRIWNSFKGPGYHVVGNHDTFTNTCDEYVKYVGAKAPYYSFDAGDFHFVVLDLNYGILNGELTQFSHRNDRKMSSTAHIPQEQLDWLRNDLQKTDKRTVLFSHQRLHVDLKNKDAFDAIIKEVNSGEEKKVIAAFAGHDHLDWAKEKNGVQHIQVNSMAYNWPNGKKFPCRTRYSEEMYKKYYIMEYMLPYAKGLYTIIEIDPEEKTISMAGMEGSWVAPTPEELNVPYNKYRSPSIAAKKFTYQ